MNTNSAAFPPAIDDAAWEELWKERWHLLFKAKLGRIYHRKRQWFYDRYDQTIQATSILAGIGIASGKTLNDFAPAIGFVIIALSVVGLVFNYSERKLLHRDLSNTCAELAETIELTRYEDLSQDCLEAWKKAHISIDRREPEPLSTLLEFCEWQILRSEGHHDQVPKPNFLRRLHMHFF